MFDVKVAKTGQPTRTIQVESGTRVEDAIEAAGYSVDEGEIIQINAADATKDTLLTTNSTVTLAKGAKGA